MQKLLLVGEGDLSFSLSLAKAFASATKITAASLDVRVGLGRQYNNGNANVKELERLGCTVVHGINVHTMSSDIACLDMTELSLIFLMQGKV
ncbi:BnaC06g06530D [Brassica napus]|uniref:BnaC06g06530D protein n=3 Tax=Brassica TaxID=3705 RepID=A0A078HE22_BRANA|nr:BnaC06g06530D [Brassica napus]VDD60569.1 unnamed protein product [Brassica oleracea]